MSSLQSLKPLHCGGRHGYSPLSPELQRYFGLRRLIRSCGHRATGSRLPPFLPRTLDDERPSGRETTTFVWASTGAGATAPKPGQCAWADRASRGSEIINGGNVICDFSSSMKSVAANTFVEVGVMRDPQVHDCMHLFRYVGATHPPFSPVPALEPFTRRSVASLSAAEIASLRKGVQVMMSRPVTDPTSYAFQANIHGTSANPTDPAESASWNDCEHGSFFFTAWHRMYLYYSTASCAPPQATRIWRCPTGTGRTPPNTRCPRRFARRPMRAIRSTSRFRTGRPRSTPARRCLTPRSPICPRPTPIRGSRPGERSPASASAAGPRRQRSSTPPTAISKRNRTISSIQRSAALWAIRSRRLKTRFSGCTMRRSTGYGIAGYRKAADARIPPTPPGSTPSSRSTTRPSTPFI